MLGYVVLAAVLVFYAIFMPIVLQRVMQERTDFWKAQADKWEERAGDIARGHLNAEQYARVAMPAWPEEEPKRYMTDPTGLIVSVVDPRDVE